ncbi:MAG TPA: helix-turn-helix domain-containing protein [Candidatus Limnocylindrales bacterium]|nr:helix-turn-helix domain-containing protein [Candidatus Limnocylindrales bacterium]
MPFRHNVTSALGFEIFRLSQLFERAEKHRLDHALESPQRPEFHTIYVGLRGKGQLIVDFTSVPLGAQVLTFVARGRVQQFVPDRAVDAWMLLFTPEFLVPGGGAPDPLAMPATLAASWAAPAIAVPPAEARALVALADQLDAEHARPFDEIQPWLLMALLRVLVLRAERLVDHRAPVPAALQRFFTILERDHATTRSVDHYARLAGLSPRRLAELVHEHVGTSTKQVIDDRVILEQKRLLVHTEVSIKELAARTGFAEPTNLVKFFRHHTGATPQGFREQHRRRMLPSHRRS